MTISMQQVGEFQFALVGELTYQTLKRLQDIAGNQLNFKEIIKIDCSGLNYCDSAGLALLVNWLKFAKLEGGRCVFLNLTEQIQKMITLMKLEALFGNGSNE